MVETKLENIEEAGKPVIVKLDEQQFKDFLVAIDYCITKELKIISAKLDERLGKVEGAIKNLEGELRLLRIEIKEVE
jgi:hypothetical protein